MKKNIFAVIFLLGLAFWGIYDMQKENISKAQTEIVKETEGVIEIQGTKKWRLGFSEKRSYRGFQKV